MNESNCTNTCSICKAGFPLSLKANGDPRSIQPKYCSDKCRNVFNNRPNKGNIYKTCPVCKSEFGPMSPGRAKRKTYCDRDCYHVQRSIDLGGDGKLNKAKIRNCLWCDAEFKRRKRKNDAVTYCSQGCCNDHRAHVAYELEAIRRIGVNARGAVRSAAIYKAKEQKEIQIRERILKKEIDAIKKMQRLVAKEGRVRLCRRCSSKFIINSSSTRFGGKLIRCNQCADDHAKEEKRKERTRRKALLRGAKRGDFIDPMDVLKAFKWKCYICGASTPKKLRGSFEDNAPEVDHIIPLSKGGSHVLSNLACACRKCNIEKSDNITFLL